MTQATDITSLKADEEGTAEAHLAAAWGRQWWGRELLRSWAAAWLRDTQAGQSSTYLTCTLEKCGLMQPILMQPIQVPQSSSAFNTTSRGQPADENGTA